MKLANWDTPLTSSFGGSMKIGSTATTTNNSTAMLHFTSASENIFVGGGGKPYHLCLPVNGLPADGTEMN
jgi:hypothetical protein